MISIWYGGGRSLARLLSAEREGRQGRKSVSGRADVTNIEARPANHLHTPKRMSLIMFLYRGYQSSITLRCWIE